MNCDSCPMKDRIALLEQIVIEGKPYTPGQADWDRAIEAFARGDRNALVEYHRRGGVVPGCEPTTKGGHGDNRSARTV